MSRITLVLHNIRSTYNVGSIFRTAEGFGVKRIIVSGYTPYPSISSDSRLPHIHQKLTKQIHKSALGAETMVPFDQVDDIQAWLENSPQPVYGLEQSKDSVMISDFTPQNDEFILLLGEEVHGIPAELMAACDQVLEIPMSGEKESFNVSVATGIALYALTL